MDISKNIFFVNGLTGDPAVCLSVPQSNENILFDCGDLGKISHKELLRVRILCISHTHMDHFCGFDQIIRVNLPHFRTLDVIGPHGILDNLVSKLRGYTWNLIEPGQLNFRVHEVSHLNQIQSNFVSNTNNFVPTPIDPILRPNPEMDFNSNYEVTVPLTGRSFSVRAISLDHGIPVCAYRFNLPDRILVSEQAIKDFGLTPGPWIKRLRELMLGNDPIEYFEVSPGIHFETKELLRKVFYKECGESVSYVTDIGFSSRNFEKLVPFLESSSVLICESNYRQEHFQKASEYKHLTTKQAALIATSAKVKSLKIFHISKMYVDESQSLVELEQFLSQLQGLDSESLSKAIKLELELLG